MSFGACGAYAPLAGLSPAPAADAAGRVKSRRPDWLKIKPHIDFGCGAFPRRAAAPRTAARLPRAMPPPDHDPVRDDDADSFEEGEEEDAAALETEADVTCPHCGKTMTITLDPGGGRAQEYVEDCQVCCRPWRVRLWYDATGAVDVQLLPVE